MSEGLKICEGCTYTEAYEENPDVFKEVLDRFAACGFSCQGPVKELAPGSSPFAVPLPRMVKKCGLDKALELALNEAGYEDTPDENTGRTMFFAGELELTPVAEDAAASS